MVLSKFVFALAVVVTIPCCSRSDEGSGASKPAQNPSEPVKPVPAEGKPAGPEKTAAPATGTGDTKVGNPPEREVVFGKYKIKMKLVTGNHTKDPKEEISPYYISAEPLPYGILRACGELAGCQTPASGEDQDSQPMQRVSTDDAKLIVKMLQARLPTHVEWINAHHAGAIQRMGCEVAQFNKISIVEEHGSDGTFETPFSDEIRFTYQREHEIPRACGMRIALDATPTGESDKH